MEHEVFVPVPVPALRRTLADPARVARCVPGFQQDADSSAGPLAGRLKFRAGGHTITYRGALALRPSDGGATFSVGGEGTEARGGGSAKLALTIGLTETDGGTTIGYSGTASGDGRIVDLDASTALTAAQRLLDRFTQQLVTESLSAESDGPGSDAAGPDGSGSDAAVDAAEESSAPEPDAGHASDAPSPDAPGEPQASGPAEPPSADTPSANTPSADNGSADKESVFDAPVPPPSLDPSAELEFTVPDEPPAEAAHARRTMIGRSTEEVDHAPPRGRYAPVPSPEAGAAGITLRWAAPAAALAIASAVVVGRALRRRRP
ncbi:MULTISPECIES: CoxG family protein [unclassified Streptomyces]|uniref:CoxG family protein n=1 Tax=unclassified Streptomyces TaxID=2593676 RepID=UPI0011C933AE|nr:MULTISPECIES: SRPBCC domain-containing protein [unclassified Streptomyces]TXS17189.1 carbon monoxide dehydrogenase [Streptomyces sp. wa22]WSR49648.1 SRPBCC domain-containing protein [Streptomyces sp. NBC_01201]